MDVDQYVAALPDAHRPVVEKLRALVKAIVPDVKEVIRWGMPVYSHHGLLCYISTRSNYVALGFYDHGRHLEDPAGLLEGSGQGRHIKIRSEDELKPKRLTSWIKQVARLNAKS